MKLQKNKPSIESIPQGNYCYDSDGICPYWEIKKNKPKQNNGYCNFLKKGDWQLGYNSLLWDMCKECNVFTELNEADFLDSKMKYFFKKVSLFNTLPKNIKLLDKVKTLISGKICRCKFCKRYFLTEKNSTNETSCFICWKKRIIRGKFKNTRKDF